MENNKISLKIDRISWSKLSKYGKNRWIRTGNFWFIVVPILVLVLSKSSKIISLALGSGEIIFDLNMPFTWSLLYMSGLFVTIANLLYTAFCPSIIKEHDSFHHFEESGKTNLHLIRYEKQLKIDVEKIDFELPASSIRYTMKSSEEKKFINQFWKLYFFADQKLKKTRILTSVCYAIATILLIVVVAVNAVRVAGFMFVK